MTRVYVDRYSALWEHTMKRIREAKQKCSKDGVLDYEKFKNMMILRLTRIGHVEKVHYAIQTLIELGFRDIAEIYDSKLVLDMLTQD